MQDISFPSREAAEKAGERLSTHLRELPRSPSKHLQI
ncbi:unnamed protein product [Brassica napus]|uniref:(rape) hypothetical protein n=1 Tax=Brassica napus TaxID=3708 RepID=A0A816PFN9_BRANA|nr:unnamed protein product [Brassica napus]